MKKIILQGKIETGYDESFDTIYLIDSDNWKIDLVDKFKEIGNNGIAKLQVNYFISDEPKSINQVKKDFILSISGGIRAEKTTESYSGSSWTGGWTEHETELKIGNHSLYSELSSYNGKFITLEIIIK